MKASGDTVVEFKLSPWKWFLYTRLAVLAALFVVLSLTSYWWMGQIYTERLNEAHQQTLKLEIHPLLERKRKQLQEMFNTMYENTRTISLLPSVREIKGGNRPDEKQDIVATHRFSNDAMNTVQQIYNNLVSRAAVSEVYAVLEGLDFKKGEVPFFMFDTIKMEPDTKEEAKDEKAKNPDAPEELEDEEYSYFPRQIAELKAAYPLFNFKQLDDIPAATSPLMRTCDNTQYYSKTQCNVYDAAGFLYSVPFYNAEDQFRGVISSIVRANAFEAA